jgi:BlaI family transcriptional regulator, penicillinase repressor
MSKLVQISDAEWVVMESLWRRGSATAADVIGDLADAKDWNHRTVRTLLTRLVNKGVLKAKAAGHRYVYQPATSREKCVREEGRSFLEKVFAGDAAELLVHFVRNARISGEEIERLRQVLNEKRSDPK